MARKQRRRLSRSLTWLLPGLPIVLRVPNLASTQAAITLKRNA